MNRLRHPHKAPFRTFVFRKVDALTGTGLAGAAFTLTGCRGVRLTAESGVCGVVRFRLRQGCYALSESAPPAGYAPDPARYRVEVDSCGRVRVNGCAAGCFTVANARAPSGEGTLNLYKISSSGEPLSGAVYELLQNGAAVAAQTTDSHGTASFTGVAPGEYSLIEKAAPPCYIPDAAAHAVTVAANGDVAVDGVSQDPFTAVNGREPHTVSVRGTKTWNDNGNAGALRPEKVTVTLYRNEAAYRFTEIDAAADASVFEFTDLPEHDPSGHAYAYSVGESPVPAGYSQLIEGTDIINTLLAPPSGTLSLVKKNRQSETLPGAVFELRQNGAPVRTAVTDSYGQAQFAGLAAGVYELTETQAPAGYAPDSTARTVTVAPDGTVTADGAACDPLTVTDLPAAVSVSGRKIWEDDGNAGGIRPGSVTVGLYRDGELFRTADAATHGEGSNVFEFADLPQFDASGREHDYTVREIGPPAGYSQRVSGNDIVNTFTAPPQPMGSLNLLKAGNDDAPLPGAEFELRSGDGTPVRTVVTGADGYAVFSGLTPGAYTLRETAPPAAYLPDEHAYSVHVYPDGSVAVDGNVRNPFRIMNERELTSVSGTKHWVDDLNSEERRPPEFTVVLYQNGAVYRTLTVPVATSEAYPFSFLDLPKFDDAGNEYEYGVEEVPVAGYDTSYDTGTDITNTQGVYVVTGEFTNLGNLLGLVSDNRYSARYSGLNVVEAGVVYSRDESFDTGTRKAVSAGFTDPFMVYLTGLSYDYWYYRAYVVLEDGTAYYGDTVRVLYQKL